jgi:Xaa-Pro dipeptidase
MKEGFLDFTREEYMARIQKARKLMESRDVDALFLTKEENLMYFTGLKHPLYNSKYWVITCLLPRDRDPVFVVPPVVGRGITPKSAAFTDVKSYATGFGLDDMLLHTIGCDPKIMSLPHLAKIVFKEYGLEEGRIGIEGGQSVRLNIDLEEFESIKRLVPRAEFVDGSDVIWACRMFKSSEEQNYMRKACEATQNAIQAGWNAIKEGETLGNVAKKAKTAMLEYGAEVGFTILGAGPPMANHESDPGHVLKKGQVVYIDLGAVYKHYYADMTRMAHIGQPSKEWRKMYEEVLIPAHNAGIDAVQPGARMIDIFVAVKSVYDKAGVGKYCRTRFGHGIGLELHELPSLGDFRAGLGDMATILEPGMVFTLEPGFHPKAKEGLTFRVEDDIVVTETGCRTLNDREKFKELYIA